MDRYGRSMLVDCFHCRTALQLPAGATSIYCSICHGITYIAGPTDPHHDRGYAPPPPPLPAHPPVTPFLPPASGFHHYPSPPHHHHHQPMPPPQHTPVPMPMPPPNAVRPMPLPPPNAVRPIPSPAPTPAMMPGPVGGQSGRKKALICGVSYKGTKHELKGCFNDAKCMKYLLVHKFNFPESNIFMLTEEERDPSKFPTKKNIRSALRWLVEDCRPGDSLVFHYSGHGSQQRDTDGDEVDGYDETLCPMDFERYGMIVDDEINDTIVKPLPSGVRLHAIIDACHSGTVLDLPFLCRMNRSGQYEWEDHRPRTGARKGTSGGEVVSFSGCDDHQTSADTSALSKTTSTGAMTYAFIRALESGEATTYGNLLNSMRSVIRNAGSGRTFATVTTSIATFFVGRNARLTQEPQLTSNEQFDVYKKTFSL